jgi:hypothetical protein
MKCSDYDNYVKNTQKYDDLEIIRRIHYRMNVVAVVLVTAASAVEVTVKEECIR